VWWDTNYRTPPLERTGFGQKGGGSAA
jgi:hypothetical protein